VIIAGFSNSWSLISTDDGRNAPARRNVRSRRIEQRQCRHFFLANADIFLAGSRLGAGAASNIRRAKSQSCRRKSCKALAPSSEPTTQAFDPFSRTFLSCDVAPLRRQNCQIPAGRRPSIKGLAFTSTTAGISACDAPPNWSRLPNDYISKFLSSDATALWP
jgi:hypothetical protein